MTTTADPLTLSARARDLVPGARIVIGRYRVELVTAPQEVPPRRFVSAEVGLVVRDVEDGALWGVTVGADQRFPLVPVEGQR